MTRVVRISLDYVLVADNEKAMTDATASLKQSYAPRQGRLETCSGSGRNGSYDVRCISMEAVLEP
jgi:hypothetical protein